MMKISFGNHTMHTSRRTNSAQNVYPPNPNTTSWNNTEPFQVFSKPLHAYPVRFFPEFSDIQCQSRLSQVPALSGGEPHQGRAPGAHPTLASQLCHPGGDERGRGVAVRLAPQAEGGPGVTLGSAGAGRAAPDTLHVAGDLHGALVRQGQDLHPGDPTRGGLPYRRGDGAPQSQVLGVDGDVAVHDVRAAADPWRAVARSKVT